MSHLLSRPSRSRPVSRRAPVLALAAAALFAMAGSARAVTPDSTAAPDGRLGDWTIGGLAYSPQPPGEGDGLAALNGKLRLGGALIPQIESRAAVRPWIGPTSGGFLTPRGPVLGRADAPGIGGAPGAVSTGLGGLMGGVLVDVPLGSFVFTPSFGAGTLPSARRDGAPTTEFRSQLELGYEFDNKSRFSLGYSRIVNDAAPSDPAAGTNNVFGLFYRLPFGGP